MAQGLERRAQPVDNLRGQEAVNPVTRSVPQMGSVPTPRVPEATFGQQIAEQVSRFAGERLQQIQAKRQERSMMDGQIAAMQGASFESVEMQGDKWALEGWRVVSAQTMASSLLRAQEADIAAGAYEQDPDTYRETLVNRIDAMTADIPDERTRMLARDNLMQQMPTLVDAHMRQNISFREQQNFDALAASVDTLSRDNNATGALVAFATGESEATAGLSIERRRAAVVQGVVNAFTNNNPAAFAHLKAAGFLTTENLTASQLQTIRSAQQQYQSRFLANTNVEFVKARHELKQRVDAGDLNPLEAVEEEVRINSRYGLLTGAAASQRIYEAAEAGVEYAEGTRGINIRTAGINGDFDLQARLLQDAVIHQESRGNPNAVSPVGATGMMQLMPATAANPGFGVRNIFQVARDMGVPVMGETADVAEMLMRNPDVNVEMGTEYLSTMLERYGGDVERALVAYNWGPGNADDWNGSRDSLPSETQGYLRNILGSINDDRPDPEAERIAAEAALKAARERAGLRSLEKAQPAMAAADARFRSMDPEYGVEQWRSDRRAVMDQFDLEVTHSVLNQEAARMEDYYNRAQEQIAKQAGDRSAVEYTALRAVADERRDLRLAQIENGTAPEGTTRQQVLLDHQSEVFDAIEQSGVEVSRDDLVQDTDNLTRRLYRSAQEAARAQELRTIRDVANNDNSVGALPPEEQKRAQNEAYRQMLQEVQNEQAENPGTDPRYYERTIRQKQLEWHARNNVVSAELETELNRLGQVDWLDKEGNVNKSALEAIRTFSQLYASNPDLAIRHVSSPETLTRMLSLQVAMNSMFPDQSVLSSMDLTSDGPHVAAFTRLVRESELNRQTVTPEDLENSLSRAISSAERGNITGNVFGGWFTTNAGTSFTPHGALSATISDHELADVHTTENLDTVAIHQSFLDQLRAFSEEYGEHFPTTDSTNMKKVMLQYVTNRGALFGNSIVMPRPDMPSMSAQMFGSRIPDNPAATHTALVEFMVDQMQTEEGLARFGALQEVVDNSFWENPIAETWRAISPFSATKPMQSNRGSFYNRPLSQLARTVSPFHERIDSALMFPPFTARVDKDTGGLVVTIPGAGSMLISQDTLREAGMNYHRKRGTASE